LNNWYKFLNIVWNLFDLINSSIYSHNLLLISVNLLNLLFNVHFLNLFKFSFSFHNHFFLNLRNNLRLTLNIILLNNLFNYLSDRLNMNRFCINIDGDRFLKIYWNRALNWLINDLLNDFYLFLLIWYSYYLINMHLNWNLLSLYNHPLFINLLHLNLCPSLNIFHHYLIRRNLDRSINCNINNLLGFNLNWFLNIHVMRNIMHFRRHLNRYLNYFFHYLLNNLRNLNYFFYDSWYNNNFLYYFLNFNNFRDLNYLLNDLLFDSWYLFNLFKINLLINNSLFFN
jgi:hypothetical protein